MDHLASAVSQLLIKTASSLNRAWGPTAQKLSLHEVTGLCLDHSRCGQGEAYMWEGYISFSHLLPTPLHHSLHRIKGSPRGLSYLLPDSLVLPLLDQWISALIC